MVENKVIKKAKKVDYFYAVGRRKTATSRIRLYKKKGDLLVNGMAIGKYFPGVLATTEYLAPLKLTGLLDQVSFSAKVIGGGKKSQLSAVIHSLARSLIKLDEKTYRPLLKKAKMLTRDDRMRQSRMVGMGGKARRKKQSPKR